MKVKTLIFKSISMVTKIVNEDYEHIATINYSVDDDDYDTKIFCSRVTLPASIANMTVKKFIPEGNLKMTIVVK